MRGAQVDRLADGRLHLHHGPIDIIARAWGVPSAVAMGEARMIARFRTILDELCSELPALRAEDAPVHGPVARAMAAAVAPFRPAFVTPMAAVAGAVADALLAELAVPGVTRAFVNDGGDIALHLTHGQSLTCAIAARPGLPDRVTIRHDDPVRGIATSGRGGRSWSFGIADAVTVLARTAAMADAAATMIGNAVDVPGHPAVTRRPACQMQADSDLGQRAVTVAVGPLSDRDIARALDAGMERADRFRRAGLIESAALFLHPEVRVLGHLMLMEPADA
ncbi:UPF0280 family protein [Fuscovulum ytuae]|uniref:UPF0280 family protein n=1 Tax=Fuscovulum ytuae TaxID=3042299 RepID=A0ABY8QC08_9RHOB|nr:UPF0280 family protein [Fuscovulum sp. YMD61]WGV18395.1 UPF0280 family protein [Fuscovulum sp. YMD61]